ncbi:MAG: YrdB family protein [Ignavibacteriaceae bacterium]
MLIQLYTANTIVLKKFNLLLRSLMEIGIVAGLGYWGFHTTKGSIIKIILAIGTPAIIFGFWGLVDFHKAGKFSESLRLLQELIISGATAFALYSAGQHLFGWILALLSIVHHILVYLIGDTLVR